MRPHQQFGAPQALGFNRLPTPCSWGAANNAWRAEWSATRASPALYR